MKLKSECCKKYKKKAKACKSCPVLAVLSQAQRRQCLKKVERKLRKAS